MSLPIENHKRCSEHLSDNTNRCVRPKIIEYPRTPETPEVLTAEDNQDNNLRILYVNYLSLRDNFSALLIEKNQAEENTRQAVQRAVSAEAENARLRAILQIVHQSTNITGSR